jgi:colanic acid/amylovoran biosynthesis glycosyltransferase
MRVGDDPPSIRANVEPSRVAAARQDLSMARYPNSELIVLSNLRAQRGPKGGLVLTQKYLNGVAEYARHWPGRVSTLVRLDERPTTDMDPVEVDPARLSFGLELRPSSEAALAERLQHAAVVLAFLAPNEAPTAALCRRLGVPLVYVSEYSVRTEKQIIDADTRNPILRWRRKLWVDNAERQRLAALKLADGVQCSGAPTFEVYRHVNRHPLMFFDNRVRADSILDEAGLSAKAAAVLRGEPLRLVFGGRLIPMKGVLDLPLVARALVDNGVPFSLDIYGGGPLGPRLEQDVRRLGLAARVVLKGVLDFEREWVPLLKERVDLFVCCHPQGDPSSTYPEVMACGVPIAGYDNEALAGVVRQSGSGWLSPLRKPRELATAIARLDQNRGEIAAAARRARAFAGEHAFERTFSRRVDHLIALSRLPSNTKGLALDQIA